MLPLTPRVGQTTHLCTFLLINKQYPSALLANEVLLNLNGTKKRCDTVLYTETYRLR
jgi:hypothetical protein